MAPVQVLRFYIVWDDRVSLYGDRRPYKLHYFVEDGTCEILEHHDRNSGRDPFPVFLRRGLLPKVSNLVIIKKKHGARPLQLLSYIVLCPHKAHDCVILIKKRWAAQNGEAPKPGYAPELSTCYGPSDLRMGTCIAVYGRMFYIYDCDDFTRKWLKVSTLILQLHGDLGMLCKARHLEL